MEKAIISLSFDDGREDNYMVFKNILEPECISATYNIATGFIERRCDVGGGWKSL